MHLLMDVVDNVMDCVLSGLQLGVMLSPTQGWKEGSIAVETSDSLRDKSVAALIYE